MYERWQANYASAFGDGVSANDYILAFAEPEYFLTDKMFIGLGGRYLNPSGQTPDDPATPVRENQLFSVAALPHFRYMPVERVFIDVTYEYAQWDPSFDLTPTTLKEDRLQELRLEIEAGF